MIKDLLHVKPDTADVADICIVGSGAAGIVLAVDLVSRGNSVLMLEAGGFDIEQESQDPYRSELAGMRHNGIHTGRFRVKGGTTTKWGGQILELDAIDFEPRSGIEDSGWPFQKAELASYYKRALELEGLGSVTVKDEEVWREINLTTPAFANLEPYFSRWCPEPNFGRLHRRTLEESDALTLWLHANAVEPIFEGDSMRALRCLTLTGTKAIFRANRFVFCLGAIESSRFFLQPREGSMPWHRSGLLGRHFQDHIDVNAAAVEPLNRKLFHLHFDNVFSRGYKYHPKLRLAPAQQTAAGTLNVAATMNFVSDVDDTLGQLKATSKNLLRGRVRDVKVKDVALAAHNLQLLTRQIARYSLQHRVYNHPEARIFLRVHCEQEPTSRSKITLSRDRDALGLFRTRLDWQISDREITSVRSYVTAAEQSLKGVARIHPDPHLLSGSPDFITRCDDSNHHMGGMRMSASPERGIVDPNLLLHGLTNTYVCSAAVFPTSGFSNPTHTLLALAVRLSEHLSLS